MTAVEINPIPMANRNQFNLDDVLFVKVVSHFSQPHSTDKSMVLYPNALGPRDMLLYPQMGDPTNGITWKMMN